MCVYVLVELFQLWSWPYVNICGVYMGACLKDHSPRPLEPVRPRQVGGEAARK